MSLHYSYVWEFLVPSERETEFRLQYGPDGGWVALFRRHPGYIETLLLQDRATPGRYLTVDRWQSIEDYRSFRARFAAEYEALDLTFNNLTRHETDLGSFIEVGQDEPG